MKRCLSVFVFFLLTSQSAVFAETNFTGIWKEVSSDSYLSIHQNNSIIITSRIAWPDIDTLPSTTVIFDHPSPASGTLDTSGTHPQVALKLIEEGAPNSFSLLIFTSDTNATLTSTFDPLNLFRDIELIKVF